MVLRKLKDESEARSALAAVAASGQARVAWAHANGVNARSLNAWRLVLERRDRARGRGGLRLVELVVPPATPAARYRVCVGELAVEVDEHFDSETLRRLLVVVSTC